MVLLVVETTDILFATDSIPAILAITRDPFIVYTSNVFAILGLRSMYFALAGMMKLFHYLNYGLSVVLMFIGAKMLLPERYHVPHGQRWQWWQVCWRFQCWLQFCFRNQTSLIRQAEPS